MFFRIKTVHGVDYLQLVETVRRSGHPRQQVRHSLGRLDHLKTSKFFDNILLNQSLIERATIFRSCLKGAKVQPASNEVLLRRLITVALADSDLSGAARSLAKASKHSGPFHQLLAEALFSLSDRIVVDQLRLSTLKNLGSQPGVRKSLTQALSKSFTENNDLVLSLHFHPGQEAASLARGLVRASVVRETGTPISFEQQPAFLPLTQIASQLATSLKARFRPQRIVLLGHRVLTFRIICSLQQAGLQYIIPVHLNRDILATNASSLEVHDINLSHSFNTEIKHRFVRCRDPLTTEKDSYLRQLQAWRFESLPLGSSRIARQQLEAQAVYDGASIFATNLPDPAAYIGDLLRRAYDAPAWSEDFHRFGSSLLDAGVRRDADELLQGWNMIALLAYNLRYHLLQRLWACGCFVSWREVQSALKNAQPLQIKTDKAVFLMNPEPNLAFQGILAAMGITPRAAMQTGSSVTSEDLDCIQAKGPKKNRSLASDRRKTNVK